MGGCEFPCSDNGARFFLSNACMPAYDVPFSLNVTASLPLDTRSSGLDPLDTTYGNDALLERPTASLYEGLLRYERDGFTSAGVAVGGGFKVYAKNAAGALGWRDAGSYMPGSTSLAAADGSAGDGSSALSSLNVSNNNGVLTAHGFKTADTINVKAWDTQASYTDENGNVVAAVAGYTDKEIVPKKAINDHVAAQRTALKNELLDGVGDKFDTLKELSAALSNEADVAVAVTTQIANTRGYAGNQMSLDKVFEVAPATAGGASTDSSVEGKHDGTNTTTATVTDSHYVDVAFGDIEAKTTVAELRQKYPTLEALLFNMLKIRAAAALFTSPSPVSASVTLTLTGFDATPRVGSSLLIQHKVSVDRGFYREDDVHNTAFFPYTDDPATTANPALATDADPAYGRVNKITVSRLTTQTDVNGNANVPTGSKVDDVSTDTSAATKLFTTAISDAQMGAGPSQTYDLTGLSYTVFFTNLATYTDVGEGTAETVQGDLRYYGSASWQAPAKTNWDLSGQTINTWAHVYTGWDTSSTVVNDINRSDTSNVQDYDGGEYLISVADDRNSTDKMYLNTSQIIVHRLKHASSHTASEVPASYGAQYSEFVYVPAVVGKSITSVAQSTHNFALPAATWATIPNGEWEVANVTRTENTVTVDYWAWRTKLATNTWPGQTSGTASARGYRLTIG